MGHDVIWCDIHDKYEMYDSCCDLELMRKAIIVKEIEEKNSIKYAISNLEKDLCELKKLL